MQWQLVMKPHLEGKTNMKFKDIPVGSKFQLKEWGTKTIYTKTEPVEAVFCGTTAISEAEFDFTHENETKVETAFVAKDRECILITA